MLESCRHCGFQTLVPLIDYFSTRKLCRTCFGELVEPHKIHLHSLVKVHVQELKSAGNQNPGNEDELENTKTA